MAFPRPTKAPWLGTLLSAVIAALVVAGAGVMLARKVERIREVPPGNRADDAFREAGRMVAKLESQWQAALEADADRLLKSRPHGGCIPGSCGIVQWSWLNPVMNQPDRAHFRADGGIVSVRPIMEKFANGSPGEWPLAGEGIVNSTGWMEMPGHPLAWVQGDGRAAVVFLLDRTAAANVVREALAKQGATL